MILLLRVFTEIINYIHYIILVIYIYIHILMRCYNMYQHVSQITLNTNILQPKLV